MSDSDPLGYYASLGVAPEAPASVIRAAYRALAMELHPDRNSSPDATRRFQTIQAAYDTLSDAVKRAAYDAAARRSQARTGNTEPPQADPQPRASASASIDPIRCKGCGSITASPRYRVFYRVFGYLVGATRSPVEGVYCDRCEMVTGLKATGVTAIVGWWSIHGFFWTIDALARNLLGARTFADQNARLLAHQAAYFYSAGNLNLAIAVARAAHKLASKVKKTRGARMREKLGYDPSDPLSDLRQSLEAFIAREGSEAASVELKYRAGPFTRAFYAQTGLLMALCGLAAGGLYIDAERRASLEEARLIQAGIEQERAAAIARQRQEILLANLQALPPSGEYGSFPGQWYQRTLPPFKVTADANWNYFIRVSDSSTGAVAATLFVRAGEETEVGIPPGTYRIKIASGHQWYGEAIRFGPTTDYSMADGTFTFEIQGRQLLGHELILQRVRDGNLRRTPIDAATF